MKEHVRWLTAWRVGSSAEHFELHDSNQAARDAARELVDDGVTALVFIAEVHMSAQREVVFK